MIKSKTPMEILTDKMNLMGAKSDQDAILLRAQAQQIRDLGPVEKMLKIMRIIARLQNQLDIAVKALIEINDSELNSQRPGGGYSDSAMLSHRALEEIRVLSGEEDNSQST